MVPLLPLIKSLPGLLLQKVLPKALPMTARAWLRKSYLVLSLHFLIMLRAVTESKLCLLANSWDDKVLRQRLETLFGKRGNQVDGRLAP